MPKTMIQATETWWDNWQAVMDTAIAACQGWTARINAHQIEGAYDAEDLLNQLEDEIRGLRNQLEAVRIPF